MCVLFFCMLVFFSLSVWWCWRSVCVCACVRGCRVFLFLFRPVLCFRAFRICVNDGYRWIGGAGWGRPRSRRAMLSPARGGFNGKRKREISSVCVCGDPFALCSAVLCVSALALLRCAFSLFGFVSSQHTRIHTHTRTHARSFACAAIYARALKSAPCPCVRVCVCMRVCTDIIVGMPFFGVVAGVVRSGAATPTRFPLLLFLSAHFFLPSSSPWCSHVGASFSLLVILLGPSSPAAMTRCLRRRCVCPRAHVHVCV